MKATSRTALIIEQSCQALKEFAETFNTEEPIFGLTQKAKLIMEKHNRNHHLVLALNRLGYIKKVRHNMYVNNLRPTQISKSLVTKFVENINNHNKELLQKHVAEMPQTSSETYWLLCDGVWVSSHNSLDELKQSMHKHPVGNYTAVKVLGKIEIKTIASYEF